jgi:hypothetical protein
MIWPRFEFRDDAEIGAKEATAEFGNQLFARTLAFVLGVAAEVTADTVRVGRPVGVMPISA